MGFLTKPDKIGAISQASGTITLQPSYLTIGGQQYATAALSYVITGLAASTKYNLFAVAVGATVSLVPSTNSITTGPTGYTKFLYLRSFMTNGSSAFGSFAGAIADPFPVGTVLDSLLTEAQFQALMGTTWILMDSRSVAGSMYAAITGASTMADARGVFRRTKNNGRGDAYADPGGERALGNVQGHAFQTHTHVQNSHTHSQDAHGHYSASMYPAADAGKSYTTVYGSKTRDGAAVQRTALTASSFAGISAYSEPTTATNQPFTATNQNQSATGAASEPTTAETRPVNITVNTFVKINME